MKFDTRVAGIPCQIEVLYYEPPYNGQRGHPDAWEESTPEYVEFDVLDRNGRPAPWLANKMRDVDYAAAHAEVIKHIRSES